jgi:hypothetical protein
VLSNSDGEVNLPGIAKNFAYIFNGNTTPYGLVFSAASSLYILPIGASEYYEIQLNATADILAIATSNSGPDDTLVGGGAIDTDLPSLASINNFWNKWQIASTSQLVQLS